MASLSLKDDVQTMEHSSQVMITRVKTIMRELGHQLETEIAHRELYQEQSKKLQGIDPIYNKTDRRKLTEARIITGADLMRLRDIRLEKDTKPQSSTKGPRSTSLQKKKKISKQQTVQNQRPVMIIDEPIIIVAASAPEEVQSNHSGQLSESDWLSSSETDARQTTTTSRLRTSKRKTTHILPDRPLHMMLRSRKT